jgi:hypothetical protein
MSKKHDPSKTHAPPTESTRAPLVPGRDDTRPPPLHAAHDADATTRKLEPLVARALADNADATAPRAPVERGEHADPAREPTPRQVEIARLRAAAREAISPQVAAAMRASADELEAQPDTPAAQPAAPPPPPAPPAPDAEFAAPLAIAQDRARADELATPAAPGPRLEQPAPQPAAAASAAQPADRFARAFRGAPPPRAERPREPLEPAAELELLHRRARAFYDAVANERAVMVELMGAMERGGGEEQVDNAARLSDELDARRRELYAAANGLAVLLRPPAEAAGAPETGERTAPAAAPRTGP